MRKYKQDLRLLTLAAVFCALIFLATAYLPRVPFPGGYIHIGDAFLYLASTLLPLPYACAVGAVGAGLADALTGYMTWVPATMIIKAGMASMFSSSGIRTMSPRNLIATIFAGVVCTGGYYLYEALLTGNFTSPLSSVYFNVIQASANALVFVILGFVWDHADLTQKLFK